MDEIQHSGWRDRLSAEFEAIIHAAVDGIIIIDAHGVMEVFNSGAERIFGYRQEDVVGRNVAMLMPPSDSKRHDQYIRNYLNGGPARIIGIGREVFGLRSNGETFPMELSVGDASTGEDRRFVGLVRDISERRRTERALADSEQRFRTLFDHAPLGIFTMDDGGRFLSANGVLRDMLGFTHDDWYTALSCFDLALVGDREIMRDALTTLLETESGKSLRRRLRWQHNNGETRIVDLHLTLTDGVGQERFVIGHVTDRTREEQAAASLYLAQQKLAQSGRVTTLGEMASAIAHEINQPLTAISTYAQACNRLLDADNPDQTTIRGAFDSIYQQSIRAGEVVRRIRGFVRDRESIRALEDINAIIRDSVDLAAFEAKESDVVIELDLSTPLVPVTVDRVQIQQVCLNLIRNAIDALQTSRESGREVVIISTATSGGVEVSVADNGSGVDEAYEDTLFQPFLTTKDEGMGMGLSLSHSIVSSHGGTLVYARRDPAGAIFTFELPAGADPIE